MFDTPHGISVPEARDIFRRAGLAICTARCRSETRRESTVKKEERISGPGQAEAGERLRSEDSRLPGARAPSPERRP